VARAVRVSSEETEAAEPAAAAGPDGTVYVGWTAGDEAAAHASTLYLSASRDGGRNRAAPGARGDRRARHSRPVQGRGRRTQVATRTRRSIEDVLAAWSESVTTERPVKELSDDEVLALSELRLADEQDASLSELLERNREGTLDAYGRRELDEMMRLYGI